MRENVVMITDNADRKFLMTIRTPSLGEKLRVMTGTGGRASNMYRGSWEALDQGYLRFKGGDAWRWANPSVDSPATRGAVRKYQETHLLLRPPDGNDVVQDNLPDGPLRTSSWGLILYAYDEVHKTNDSGTGEVKQPWAVGMKPGEFKWKLATEADLVAVRMQNR